LAIPLPRIAITPGEPAGIGPDICLALASQPLDADIVFVADPDILQQRADQLGIPVKVKADDGTNEPRNHEPGTLRVITVHCPDPVTAGQLNTGNAAYVVDALDRAIRLVHEGPYDALVTAPVHKGIINEAGIPFTGHTEWLAERTGARQPVMMLANNRLRVALATTHLPLSRVSDTITRERLETVIRVLHHDLQSRFHIDRPRIRVCGLNPHAGEDGHLGHEEIEIMIPLMESLRDEGLQVEGPVPADTAFLTSHLDDTDAILAMYHDQGLPVLKFSDFEHAVNITLGLPIIRTSVDHGTALELAGTGKASASSLFAAVDMAITMARPGS